MSDTTARTIRLVKAQGILDAANGLLENLYDPATSAWERNYNYATRDAINHLKEMAERMSNQ